MADYFYDAQIRRFLIQFAKIFSNWTVTRGVDANGNKVLVRIPIIYGDMSRQVASVISNNTASTLPSAPLLTYYITGLDYEQSRSQEPTLVDKREVRQRKYNPDTQMYDQIQGQAFTIERMMPTPYLLRLNLDLWTTNYNQKLEFVEQVGPLFNPGLEIQSTDNFLDWTSLSIVLQDGTTWTSRSVPQGTGNPIDIFSWKFKVPIWLSLPAKQKKMGVIQKVIASIHKGTSLDDMQDEDFLYGTRQKITPYGYKVLLIGNTLQLLPANQPFNPSNYSLDLPENPDTSLYWDAFLNAYGTVRPGVSQIWLQNPYMDYDIVGTIVPDPVDNRLLIYDIDPDTLPANTLSPINGVINPLLTGPSAGLPGPINGTRYLLVEDIGNGTDPTIAWGTLVAKANDIIEYNNSTGEWFVSFDSALAEQNNAIEYVLNLKTNVQFRFTDGIWQKAYEGWYEAGDFSIVI